MNVRLEQLASQLQQGLKAVYIVSGDEPLQVQEACQLIRDAAKAAHFSERQVFSVEATFKWDEFLAAGSELSLFASQKIIELRLPNGKPGTEGSKALLAYTDSPSENNLLLISTCKLDKSAQNSKWFKALDQLGAHIAVWPIEAQQLPKWIEQRMSQAGLQPEREATALLAELVDGNLLAATQEIDKLKLLLPEGDLTVSAETVRDCVVNSSRYNVFNLIDNALKGDSKQCLKMLGGLRDEGVEPLSVVWVLSREIRQLALLKHEMQRGRSADQAMQAQRVWRNRQPLINKALARLSVAQLASLSEDIAFVDQLAKGMHQGNPWDQLEQITLTLAGLTLPASR